MQFLDPQNVAGQTLLRITARGSAIIAELLRLSSHIPSIFKLEDKAVIAKRYHEILLDFSYVSKADAYESKIEKDPVLNELDLDFKENYLEILKRFYSLFESIYKYIKDLERYVDDVEQGNYIHLTLEGLLTDEIGKQLLIEALYLYGVMLILMDKRIDGLVRERMLVCVLRYIGQNEMANLDEVCKLCARTGFDRISGKRPPKYPESYFGRFSLPQRVVEMIIGRLRSDDIYNQVPAYPLPEHRSAALAQQAAMLYVILYFVPSLLNNESAPMREIVDKHFPDNWVIAYYMGFTADLSVEWEPYRAAKLALNNTVTAENLATFKARHVKKLEPIMQALQAFLTEGVLVEEFLLEKRNRLFACLRDANVTLRWLILHMKRSTGKVRQLLNEGFGPAGMRRIYDLLVHTAQFEFALSTLMKSIINSKQEKWDECRKESAERMRELGEYFSGEKPLTKIKKNERLQRWFSQEIAATIDSLDINDATVAGRKMQQLIQALEEVQQYHDIETNLQVKQFLSETIKFLKKMLRLVNIGDEVMVTYDIVSDAAYVWEIVTEFMQEMQDSIRQDPRSVLKLRSLFLKLSSILSIPCLRINEAKSPDLVSVSQYYSGELVAFVRNVMEVVPRSMFIILKEIIAMQTNQLKELPTKVDKDAIVKDFSQLDLRFKLSEATYKVSVFTRGVLAMETTFVGLVAIDPKKLLEDGIRKELVAQICGALHQLLIFQSHKIEEFEFKLHNLSSTLDGFKRSFQYIQDYVNIYGLKVWQEEFSRIVNFHVEQECNPFLKRKVFDWQSSFQSEAIPIPQLPPVPNDLSVNFIGRLGRELLLHTNPTRTIYLDKLSAWYDPSNGRELISLKTFAMLLRSVDVFGLVGLDKLLAFMIINDLKNIINNTIKTMKMGLAAYFGSVAKKFGPLTETPTGIVRLYQQIMKDQAKAWAFLPELFGRIGQKQLIRRQIANILNISCKLDSNVLYSSLSVMNDALLKDVRAHNATPETHPYPDNEYNALHFELSKYLIQSGVHNPLSQVYITSKPIEDLDLFIALFTLSQVSKWQRNDALGVMANRSGKGSVDASVMSIGIITLLKQFHSQQTSKFLGYIGQYIRSSLETGKESSAEFPGEVHQLLCFLEDFCKYGDVDRPQLLAFVPQYILDEKTVK